ncbi:unnamed protein product [Commensalibacter communis]|nr:unnamed protein product [Commensalibacter communis]
MKYDANRVLDEWSSLVFGHSQNPAYTLSDFNPLYVSVFIQLFFILISKSETFLSTLKVKYEIFDKTY